jgi:very-short-patch-repair endonuclease
MTKRRLGHPDSLCAHMAEVQHGIVTEAQLRAAGLDKRAIFRRVESGRLDRQLPGVFVVAGAPRTLDRDLMAAVSWAGDEAAASGHAAAWRWGFDKFDSPPIEISTTNRKHCTGLRLPDGTRIIVHRVDRHLVREIVRVGNIPVTSARRTVLDLAGMKHRRTESVVDAILRRGLHDIGDLWLYLDQEWMRGRRGVGILRDILIPRTEGRAPSDSNLELMMRRVLNRHGLPEPIHQYRVALPSGEIHVDIAYPHSMLAIEVDGYMWHMDRLAFEEDRRRDNELRALGWTVFRFTWAMLRFDSGRVAELVAQHLSRAA